jgi:hypothetical protein
VNTSLTAHVGAEEYPFSPEETTPPKEEEMPPFDGLKMK